MEEVGRDSGGSGVVKFTGERAGVEYREYVVLGVFCLIKAFFEFIS